MSNNDDKTVLDPLNRAFDDLNNGQFNNQPKIRGFADYVCCTTCANHESADDMRHENLSIDHSDQKIIGGINWHNQDSERIENGVKPYEAYLGFVIFDEQKQDDVMYYFDDDDDDEIKKKRFDFFMNLVKERLELYGLIVTIPIDYSKKIKVVSPTLEYKFDTHSNV